MKTIIFNICLFFSIALNGCNFGAGTHGFIKAYEFDISTDSMRTTIEKFIDSSEQIKYLDRKKLIIKTDSTGKVIDTLSNKDYYNDGKQYSRIIIFHNVDTFEFVLHYRSLSDISYISNFCTISIIQAFKEGDEVGGYSRNFGMFQQKVKQSYIKIFETEFIDKLPYKYIRTEEP